MFNAKITVHYKESVIDAPAQQTLIALEKISPAVSGLKIGRIFDVTLDASSREEAEKLAHQLAKELLVNQVMENYTLEIVEVQ